MPVPLPSPSSRSTRVADAHDIVRTAFRLAGLFIAWAAGWTAYRAFSPGSWWGPLHSFMVGGVLLAISGATQLFSITWAAASAPRVRITQVQRWLIASGASVAIVGATRGTVAWVMIGAALVVGGLATLGWILVGVTRRSLLGRFGLSSRFYLLAIVAGVIGVSLGGLLGAGVVPDRYSQFRVAHMHLNLVGMVGFTIVGTLPTILPTMARHRMVSGREAVIGFWVSAAALGAMVVGAVAGRGVVGVGVGLAALGAGMLLAGILVRLGPLQVVTAGLPALLVTSGSLWLVIWMFVRAVSLIEGGQSVWERGTAVGVGGVALVLFGSLAYLVPVLLGPGSDLAANFRRMRANPWIRGALANGVVLAVAVGLPGWSAVAMGGAFLLDFGVRVVGVVVRDRRRHARQSDK